MRVEPVAARILLALFGVALLGCGDDTGSTLSERGRGGAGGTMADGGSVGGGGGTGGTTGSGGTTGGAGNPGTGGGAIGGSGVGGFAGLFVGPGILGGFSGGGAGGAANVGGSTAPGGAGGATAGSSATGGTGRTLPAASGGGPGDFVSGTRLRAVVDDAGGGAKIFVAWQDQVLGKRCRFVGMTDGSFACVPWDMAGVVFLDAGCTQPAIAYVSGGDIPPWAVHFTLTGCSVSVVDSVYVPTAEMASPPAVMYVRDNAQSCSQATPYSGWDWIYLHAALATQSPFVGATATHGTDASGVSAETLTASDGAQQTVAGWDLVRETECLPASALWGRLFPSILPGYLIDDRCVPTQAALNAPQEYADSSCTMEIASGDCAPGVKPEVAIKDVYTASGGSECNFGVYDIGDVLQTTFDTFSGDCAPASQSRGPNPFFLQGPAAAADEYPRLGRVETGTGRIKVRNFVASSGPAIGAQPVFHDSELAVDCGPLSVDSSTRICFPENASLLSNSGGLFADPACTVKLFAWDHRCGLPDPAFVLQGSFTPLTPARAVPYTGTSVYANGYDNITGCLPITPPAGTTLFTAGDPVPTSTFVPIFEAME